MSGGAIVINCRMEVTRRLELAFDLLQKEGGQCALSEEQKTILRREVLR